MECSRRGAVSRELDDSIASIAWEFAHHLHRASKIIFFVAKGIEFKPIIADRSAPIIIFDQLMNIYFNELFEQ